MIVAAEVMGLPGKMPVQGCGIELRQDVDLGDTGIDAI